MRVLARNKKAQANYYIVEKWEAGIVLRGDEVKSIKNGQISLKEAYIKISRGEAFIINAHIAPYQQKGRSSPKRDRKLLLKKSELERLTTKQRSGNYLIIPLSAYLKNNFIKLSIGLGQRLKKQDQREKLKQKALRKDIESELKRKNF